MITTGNQYLRFRNKYSQYKQILEPALTSKKGRAYSMMILSFFTMAFFGAFALRPTLAIIARLNRQIIDSRQLDQKLTDKIMALSSLQSDYQLISGAVPFLYKALPSQPEVTTILSGIERIAFLNQITISALNVDTVTLSKDTTGQGSIVNIPMTLTVSGRFESIIRFLEQLLKNPRIVRIDRMNISSQGSDDEVVVSVSIQANGYYYP